jgi:hypothetical protein
VTGAARQTFVRRHGEWLAPATKWFIEISPLAHGDPDFYLSIDRFLE